MERRYAPCTSPVNLTGLSAAVHTFQVRAADESANTDATPASRTFTVTSAATVNAGGGAVSYQAGAGESNALTVSGGGAQPLAFVEGGSAAPVAGAGCSQVTASRVECPAAGVSSITVGLGDGADTLNASAASGVSVSVNGGNGPDQITGTAGDDSLSGGSGDAATDRLTGGPGNDTLDGGPGIDRALYVSSTGGTDVTIGDGPNDSDGLGGTDNLLDSIESITGGPGADVLTGSCLPNTLAGQGGNDTIVGSPAGCAVPSGDFMGGGTGDDSFVGGAGTDAVTYTSNAAGQPIDVSLDGAPGDDDGQGGSDNVAANIESVYGGAGDDTIDASAASQGVSLWGRAGNDTLLGSAFNDFLRGEAGADELNCGGRGERHVRPGSSRLGRPQLRDLGLIPRRWGK